MEALVGRHAEGAGADGAGPRPCSLIAELLILSKATRALVSLRLAEIGLHSGQDELILALRDDPRQSVSAMADALGVRPSTVSKMLDRLTERGFVFRSSDDRDARRTMVELTADGLVMIGRIESLHERLDAELCRDRDAVDHHTTSEEIRRIGSMVVERLRRFR